MHRVLHFSGLASWTLFGYKTFSLVIVRLGKEPTNDHFEGQSSHWMLCDWTLHCVSKSANLNHFLLHVTQLDWEVKIQYEHCKNQPLNLTPVICITINSQVTSSFWGGTLLQSLCVCHSWFRSFIQTWFRTSHPLLKFTLGAAAFSKQLRSHLLFDLLCKILLSLKPPHHDTWVHSFRFIASILPTLSAPSLQVWQ